MSEEMPKNEDVIFNQQNDRVKTSRGNPINRQRRHVSAGWLIAWHLLALMALCLWMLRLLGAVSP